MAKQVAEQFTKARTITAAMFGSVCVYGVMAFVMRQSAPAQPEPLPDVVRVVFYGLAAGVQLPCSWIAARIRPGTLPPATAPTPEVGLGAVLVARQVVRLAIAEVPAILGLLLFFIQHTLVDFLSLAAFSLLLMCMRLPRKEEWQEVAREQGYRWSLG